MPLRILNVDVAHSLEPTYEISNKSNFTVSRTSSDWITNFYVASLCIICILSVVGNSLLCFALLKKDQSLSPSNRLVFSLSSSNLALSLLVLPFAITSFFKNCWIFGIFWCNFTAFVTLLVTTSSVLTLAAIAIDRYYAIVKPMMYSLIVTNARSLHMLLSVWILAFLCSSPPLFGWSQYYYHPDCFLCLVIWQDHASYAAFVLLISFLLPVVIMLVCYGRIFKIARSKCCKVHVGTICRQPESSAVHQVTQDSNRRISFGPRDKPSIPRRPSWLVVSYHSPVKSFLIISIIIGNFLLTWCSYVVVILAESTQCYLLPLWQERISLAAAFCSSLSYPLIYGLLNRSIRKDILFIFHSLCAKTLFRKNKVRISCAAYCDAHSENKQQHGTTNFSSKIPSSEFPIRPQTISVVSVEVLRKPSQDSGTYSECAESDTTLLPGSTSPETYEDCNFDTHCNVYSQQHCDLQPKDSTEKSLAQE